MIRSFVTWNRRLAQRFSRRFPQFCASPSYRAELQERVELALREGATAVLETGGIDRPLLRKGAGFLYDGLDIEDRPACHEIYDHFWVQSVEQPIPARYDLIMSMTLLEHVPSNQASSRAMADSLVQGGSTHHYIPGAYHPYAVLTRLVGPKLQKRLIGVLRPQAVHLTGYPAYFDHCTPRSMARLFRGAGLVDIECRPFYRANDYFAFFFPLFLMLTAFENLCRRLDWSIFASGFVISARKPLEVGQADQHRAGGTA